MDECIDDDVLSYFTNDIESDGGLDSADELLDILATTEGKKNIEEEPGDDDDDDRSDEEVDEDTQAQIAALQAKIEKLKSSKKSPKEGGKKESKNKIQVERSKKEHVRPQMKVDGQCKHGAPVTQCFFCSKTPNTADVAKKTVVTKSNSEIKSENACKHGKLLTQCFFCSGLQSTEIVKETAISKTDVTKKAIVNGPVIGKPKGAHEMDDLPEKKSPSIFDVLPAIDGQPTSEFSKKRRVAHDVTIKESEDNRNFKKAKVEANGESGDNRNFKQKAKAQVIKEGGDHGKFKKKAKVEEKVEKEHIDTTMSAGKGNSQFFGGVEISKPIMSSTIFDEKIKGRNLIKISKIETKVKGHDIEGDWVTVGVLVKKVTQKQSSSGKPFCVWHISDLGMGTENIVVALFLFGESYKQHWKIQAGRVIALLNANLMKQDKHENQQIAITIDNPKKLMELGDSKYLGGCKGNRKSDGKPCTMYINKKYGDFCEYHVQAAFKKAKVGRMELQSGGRGPQRKGKMLNNLKKDISEGTFYYGGKTVTLQEESKVKKTSVLNNCAGLKSLMGIQVRIQAAKEYNDMKLKREQDAKLQKDYTVSTFLKQNRNELLSLDAKKDSSGKTSVGNVNKIQKEVSSSKSVTKLSGKEVERNGDKPKGDKKRDLCDLKFFEKNESTEDKKKASPKVKSNLLKSAPVLGRSFKGSDFLEFAADIDDFCYEKHTGEEPLVSSEDTFKVIRPNKNTGDASKDLTHTKSDSLNERSIKARNKAISIVQAKGPITLEDPNIDIVKKKPKSLESIEKMVDICDKSLEEKSQKSKEVAKQKKSMLAGILGQIDLNSAAGKQLLQQKSKHVGAVKLAEAEREEKYFDSLEKKENMQEKMTNTFEIKVSGIACRECKYLAESQSELCKDSGHAVAKIPNMIKRFFICKSCKTRCCAYNKIIPKKACTRCGERNFEKAPMVMERKGPLIGGETLELRGREQKFINSY